MPQYRAPIRDMQFVHRELLDADELRGLPGCEEVTDDLVDAILTEAAKLAEEVFAPINRPGDEQGATFHDGEVRTPDGFREAYASYVEGGWPSLAADPAYGGQGLPHLVSNLVEEMICSANLSFGMYPGLTQGAYRALAAHASEEIKQRFLPKLVDGTWCGTMCLTEPQCGTDLGLIRTRAEPTGEDGAYRITGTKIFISAGEHDLTANIVHLVLARTPDAPAGIKGISLFVVPKHHVDADGNAGGRNAVACGAIEHKMGIRASSTCVMNFDGATGFLVGELNKGMRAMFTMMNLARLGVGLQGLGIGEAAYQGAVAYARERLQGRALGGARYPDRPADPILVHPDVRRMLLTMRAYVEGNRALAAWVSSRGDVAERHPDPEVRQAAEDLIGLLTPVVKAFFTDTGFEAANIGVQVLGGHGFIREHGMEQLVRDARITQLYEGTNGIQALDLVGRKLPANMGRSLRQFFHPIQSYITQHHNHTGMQEFVEPLSRAFKGLQKATGWLAQEGLKNPDAGAAGATEYLRLFGLVALAWMWCRMAEVALDRLGSAEGAERVFYQAKVDTARFFMQRILPGTIVALAGLTSGSGAIMDFDDDAFVR